MTENSVCLASIVHDPDGKLAEITSDIFSNIRKFYNDAIIEVTDKSSQKLINVLGKYSHINLGPNGRHLGRVRYNVLKMALTTDCNIVHYIDFDRLLYWYLNFSQELRLSIKNLHSKKMTVFGRTKLAFDSHPWLQRETENIVNRTMSWRFGYDIDILSGSRGIPRAIGQEIMEKSVKTDWGCANDAEWPLIAGSNRIRYVEVNGLGYESWLLGVEKSESDEVFARLRNLQDIMEVLYANNYYDVR